MAPCQLKVGTLKKGLGSDWQVSAICGLVAAVGTPAQSLLGDIVVATAQEGNSIRLHWKDQSTSL
jgi:hypothetical protein